MTLQTAHREQATPGASSHNITQRLKALAARPSALTVHQVIDDYMAQYAGRDTTRIQRLSAWDAMIGEFTLENVDSDLIHAGRAELATKPPLVFVGLDHMGQQIFKVKSRRGTPCSDKSGAKSNGTLNRYMVAIAAVFTWAIESRIAPKGWVHPCRGIRCLKESAGRVRFLDAPERSRLFAAVKASQYPRLYALTLMAMKTGARRGELLALTWRDIDLKTGIASLGKTKNGDRRTLVLLPDVIAALEPFKSTDLDRFVFGSVRSKYQVPTSIDSAWRDAVERAKIKNFKFHDLRHCCASYMAQAGIPLNVIAEVLGHRKLDMTRRYSHLTTQTKASAMLCALGGIQ